MRKNISAPVVANGIMKKSAALVYRDPKNAATANFLADTNFSASPNKQKEADEI